MANASITWLGHASFRLDTPGGKRVYVDPWLKDNPKCPEGEQKAERADLVLVTHAHFDHLASAAEIANEFEAPLVAGFELANWFSEQGVETAQGMGKGGSAEFAGLTVTVTNAFHSSSTPDGKYGGEPVGYVLKLEDGFRVYFSGDTCVFGDMALIKRLYAPDLAVLPIGSHFTMDPREAAVACELLGVKHVVPCHYGTFPFLTGTPDDLRREVKGVEVLELTPGQTQEL